MYMKTCSKCKEEKDISLFAVKKGKSREICKDCLKVYMKNHYNANKQSYFKSAKKTSNKLIGWFREYKSTLSCSKCEETHIATLDFHHRNPKEKEGNIGVIMYHNKWSKERILEEISKCDVLCANCHRKLHWEEKCDNGV